MIDQDSLTGRETELTRSRGTRLPVGCDEDAVYQLVVNCGNDESISVASLDSLPRIARAYLIGRKDRELTLRIVPLVKQGPLAAERADGVK